MSVLCLFVASINRMQYSETECNIDRGYSIYVFYVHLVQRKLMDRELLEKKDKTFNRNVIIHKPSTARPTLLFLKVVIV